MNSYHRTHYLLFQFILYEYIRTTEEAHALKALLKDKLPLEVFCHLLTEHLIRLAGAEQEYMRIFSWIVDSGFLTKLKNYADALLEQSSLEKAHKTAHLKLLETAHRAWSSCLLVLDELRSPQKKSKTLKAQLQQALGAIEDLNPLIQTLIPYYKNNENILFFLLRYKERFDHIHEKDWTAQFLRKLHPQGTKNYMMGRYKERGFTDVVAQIEELYDAR